MSYPAKQSAIKEEKRKSDFFNNSSMMTKGGGWGDVLQNFLCVYIKTVPDGGLEEFTPRPDAGWLVQTCFCCGIDAKTCRTKEGPELRISLQKVIIG